MRLDRIESRADMTDQQARDQVNLSEFAAEIIKDVERDYSKKLSANGWGKIMDYINDLIYDTRKSISDDERRMKIEDYIYQIYEMDTGINDIYMSKKITCSVDMFGKGYAVIKKNPVKVSIGGNDDEIIDAIMEMNRDDLEKLYNSVIRKYFKLTQESAYQAGRKSRILEKATSRMSERDLIDTLVYLVQEDAIIPTKKASNVKGGTHIMRKKRFSVKASMSAKRRNNVMSTRRGTMRKRVCANVNGAYPYLYVLKHGLGPGTLPRDVKIGKTDEYNGYTLVWLNRFLTTSELREYDIPSESNLDRYLGDDLDRFMRMGDTIGAASKSIECATYPITETDEDGQTTTIFYRSGKWEIIEDGYGLGVTDGWNVDRFFIYDYDIPRIAYDNTLGVPSYIKRKVEQLVKKGMLKNEKDKGKGPEMWWLDSQDELNASVRCSRGMRRRSARTIKCAEYTSLRDRDITSADDVTELVLYITNDADLYYKKAIPIIENLKRKAKKGQYDDELAIKAWQYLADDGVRKYDMEFGSGRGSVGMLNPATRKEIAKQLRDYYKEQVFYDIDAATDIYCDDDIDDIDETEIENDTEGLTVDISNLELGEPHYETRQDDPENPDKWVLVIGKDPEKQMNFKLWYYVDSTDADLTALDLSNPDHIDLDEDSMIEDYDEIQLATDIECARDTTVSPEDVRELVLYITNNAQMYGQIKSAIANLKRKIARGIYDPEKAVDLMKYIADDGVKRYGKQFGQGASVAWLNPATRKEIAKQLLDYYNEDIFEDVESSTDYNADLVTM